MVRGSRTPIVLALLAILLVASALRFWRLGELPPGLYHDEAYNGLDALSLLAGRTFPIFYEGWELYAQDAHAERSPDPTRFPVFFEGNFGREPLHVYLMAFSVWLAGATPQAIRAVPAAAGVLAVFTTFLAARALLPPQRSSSWTAELMPLLAALSLALLYPAVHFSRFGIRAMVFIPCATLAVWAFWRGWRAIGRRSLFWLGVAGFFVGLGLYTYAAARLFPLLFAGFFAYVAWRDLPALKQRWQPIVIMVAMALLTAAPLLLFFVRYPYYFFFRIAYVANKGAGTVPDAPLLTWLNNIGRVVGGLFWQGETHLRHNLPGRPYMDLVQAGLFLVGAVRSGLAWRKPEPIFLLLWLVVMLLPSILSGDAPHFGRMTGAAPAIAILIGSGATWLIATVSERLNRRAAVVGGLVALLFAPSLLLTTRDYFIRYAAHPDLARDFQLSDWQMGKLIAGQPKGTVAYLTPTQQEMATIYFALADPDGLRSYSGDGTLLPAGIPDRPSLHLVRPSEGQALLNLQAYLSTGEIIVQDPAYTAYYTTAGAERVVTAQLTDTTFDNALRLRGYTRTQSEEALEMTLVWQAIRAPQAGYTAYVHVLDENGALVAQTDRPPQGYPTTEWRPGEVIVDRFTVALPDGLPAGTYRLVTGFYSLPGVTPLGQPAEIGTVVLD